MLFYHSIINNQNTTFMTEQQKLALEAAERSVGMNRLVSVKRAM